MPALLLLRAATVKAAPDGSRRASSADLERPLSSVHAASSDGAHEAQQRDQPIGVVTGEALEERGRQPARIDRRHERGASDLPEWCRGEAVTPPCAPALDGAAIDADPSVSSRMRSAVAPCRRVAINTTIAAI